MYFDGALNQKGFEEGILLVSPEVAHTHLLVTLGFELINNVV